MEILKNSILALVLCLSLACMPCSAQHGRGMYRHGFTPDSLAHRQTERMKADLSLSGEQVKQVEIINLKYARKMKELREEMLKKMQGLDEEKQKELEGVLNKEQMDKLKQKKEARRKEFKNKKGCKKK